MARSLLFAATLVALLPGCPRHPQEDDVVYWAHASEGCHLDSLFTRDSEGRGDRLQGGPYTPGYEYSVPLGSGDEFSISVSAHGDDGQPGDCRATCAVSRLGVELVRNEAPAPHARCDGVVP